MFGVKQNVVLYSTVPLKIFEVVEINFNDGMKADMWSVGVVCFMIVFGYPPFNAAVWNDSRFMYLKRDGNRLFWDYNTCNISHNIDEDIREIIKTILVIDLMYRSKVDDVDTMKRTCFGC